MHTETETNSVLVTTTALLAILLLLTISTLSAIIISIKIRQRNQKLGSSMHRSSGSNESSTYEDVTVASRPPQTPMINTAIATEANVAYEPVKLKPQ